MKIKRNKQGKVVFDTSTPIDEQIASLSKIANRQLTILEKLSKEPGFAGATAVGSTAYSIAQRDIMRINSTIGSKKNGRFESKIKPENVRIALNLNKNISPETLKRILSNFDEYVLQKKEQQVSALIRFLNSPTYSKKRIEAMYIKAVNTINEKYGTNFTWLEWHKFLEDDKFDKLDRIYDSDQALQLIAAFQKGKKELVKAVYGSMKQSGIRTNSRDNELTNYEIYRLLYKNKDNTELANVKRKLKALNIK